MKSRGPREETRQALVTGMALDSDQASDSDGSVAVTQVIGKVWGTLIPKPTQRLQLRQALTPRPRKKVFLCVCSFACLLF